ncbi:hypothetical protein niasHS_013267 [Heterodera schachtii]|uniref:G-protein coupled receptors family 1 profile domain-containing protein n=1 Tax=Heterodera schachtii TaxID=97005 RepID=A0ABD2IDA7_HETSC
MNLSFTAATTLSNFTLSNAAEEATISFSVPSADDAADAREMQARATIKLVFCIAYAILFLLGSLGNGLVIVMICNVLSTLSRNRRKTSRKMLMASAEHVFIYVLGLSIVDLFVILHLPLLIFEMREGQWPFGEFMCKLYWFGESVNKLLSSFLMTVLSWDRYLAVCSPIKSMKMRTNSVAITVLISCSAFATLLLYPVLKEATVLRVNKLTGVRLHTEDDGGSRDSSRGGHGEERNSFQSESERYSEPFVVEQQPIVHKCVFDTNSPLFMLYTFGVGFLVPALLITFFYLRVILKLRADAISVRKHSDGQNWALSSARFHKVTKRIVAVILFYFLCWTPYWTLNIMSQFGIIIVSWSTLTLSSVFFIAHLLVCFNSAANPVLYALINRELRQQNAQALQKRRRSLNVATNNAKGFIEKQFPTAPMRKEQQRGASVGFSDDSHQRLLKIIGMKKGPKATDNDKMLEKNDRSFSNSAPALFPPFYANCKRGRRLFSCNGHFLHPFGGGGGQKKSSGPLSEWKETEEGEGEEGSELDSVATGSVGDAFL